MAHPYINPYASTDRINRIARRRTRYGYSCQRAIDQARVDVMMQETDDELAEVLENDYDIEHVQ